MLYYKYKHDKGECMSTSYYERNKEKILKQRKERYDNDPEYKQKSLQQTKQWRLDHADEMKVHRQRWEHSNPEWIMYHNAKRRARDANVPFDISFKDIQIPDVCPILQIKLSSEDRETTPSLDRIIPSLGYTKDNIQVISMRANRIKNDGTLEEFKAIIKYLESH